jgi:hypothetical protein
MVCQYQQRLCHGGISDVLFQFELTQLAEFRGATAVALIFRDHIR